jgi:hypothetical protein
VFPVAYQVAEGVFCPFVRHRRRHCLRRRRRRRRRRPHLRRRRPHLRRRRPPHSPHILRLCCHCHLQLHYHCHCHRPLPRHRDRFEPLASDASNAVPVTVNRHSFFPAETDRVEPDFFRSMTSECMVTLWSR